MKISLAVLNNNATIPGKEDNVLTFHSSAPAILQPSEIKKVRTGLAIRELEKGYILQIVAHPELHEKGVAVFPGPFVIDSTCDEELFIPLQNGGRGQVNLLPGDIIARGVVIRLEAIEIEQVKAKPEKAKPSPRKTQPAKKNVDFKFEIK